MLTVLFWHNDSPNNSIREQTFSKRVAKKPTVETGPKIPTVTIPLRSPTAEEQPKSTGSGIRRWKIDPLPTGWDPELAAIIAQFAEAMDTDGQNPEDLLKVEKARLLFIEELANLGPESLPTLDAILNAESLFMTRRHILYRIGEFGPESEEATFSLMSFYRKLHRDDKARGEVNHVIAAMSELENDTSLTLLSDMTESDEISNYDRGKFIEALGDHPRAEEQKEVFIDRMSNGTDSRVRNYSAQAIGKLAEERRESQQASAEFLPDLMVAFEGENKRWVRQTVLGSMGKVGDPSALPFLEEVARMSDDRQVRLSAANAVRRIGQHSGSRRAWSILEDLSRTEPDGEVRLRLQRWHKKH